MCCGHFLSKDHVAAIIFVGWTSRAITNELLILLTFSFFSHHMATVRLKQWSFGLWHSSMTFYKMFTVTLSSLFSHLFSSFFLQSIKFLQEFIKQLLNCSSLNSSYQMSQFFFCASFNKFTYKLQWNGASVT